MFDRSVHLLRAFSKRVRTHVRMSALNKGQNHAKTHAYSHTHTRKNTNTLLTGLSLQTHVHAINRVICKDQVYAQINTQTRTRHNQIYPCLYRHTNPNTQAGGLYRAMKIYIIWSKLFSGKTNVKIFYKYDIPFSPRRSYYYILNQRPIIYEIKEQ